ncbi:MAG TPA: glycosyltransferase family 2 protein [Candidatus Krumholzibacteria bacterium]|nr:glycosyltransferase family 2 protein [Candidatus Krumholzibacteria bacterium]
MEWARDTLASLYYVVCALLVLYGSYRIVLLVLAMRALQHRRTTPEPVEWPAVSVQLPLYNERFVARRLLEAVANLDYPRDRLQIQILDDSTDCTTRLTRRGAAVLRRRGFDVQFLHRDSRRGFKAGALAAGLERARGEVLAIFDADFVPPRDFLRRSVPHLLQPGVGVVQARWGHLNREASWLTRTQSILLDGHFIIEQTARDAAGCFLSFNGTCGVLRRQAVLDAGGWSSDTVTEDLDLSVRMQMRGWRVSYLHDLVVPGEVPADANSFRAQQRRWTKGGVQVARKLLPRILRSPLPWPRKVEAFLHLTCYGAYPLLLGLALLRTPVRVFAPTQAFLGFLPGEIELLALGTLPLIVFYAVAARHAGHNGSGWRLLGHCLGAMTLGAGLAVSNTRAVLEGLHGDDHTFERTPKQGWTRPLSTRSNSCGAVLPASYRSPGTTIAIAEIAIVFYLVLWKVFGTGLGMLGDLPFLIFFCSGLLQMALPALRRWLEASATARWASS